MNNPQTKSALNNALSTYPLYQGKKLYDMIPSRDELNTKILNHYKYREIGFETVGRFLDELEISMCEIMPRYNELFKTIEIMGDIEDPFGNVDVTETYKETRTGTSSNSSNGTDSGTATNTNTASTDTTNDRESTDRNQTDNTGKTVGTQTPGSRINVPANSIDTIDYADNVGWNKDTTFNNTDSESSETSNVESSSESTSTNSSSRYSESSGTSNDVIEHEFHKTGNQGVNTYAHDMIEYRDVILDVVNQILDDVKLQQLFMMVY